ncbi:MAG: TetR/AcrR family transcriptional regulator [Myxococcales bacterium]|nr:TetR/AcrR family transcriptional regulator [Myxococcales bacterium]
MSRRKPVQRRAEERRRSLLDAATRLLERDGYEAVTTNAIATEAGAAVGTVYDYFPNKEALLAALLARYQERLQAHLLASLGEGAADRDALVERGVRAFASFYRQEPGYAALWLGSQLVTPLREAGERWGADFGDLLGPLVASQTGLDAEAATRVARVLAHAVSAVVTLALQVADGPAIEDEAVRLARAYLREVSAPS